MSKPGNEIHPLLREIRDERTSGKIYKRFEDDYYALDLLKILYDDTVENSIKVELLINLEEYGLLGITEDSIDQIVTSLLDIYHQCVDKGDNWPVVCQILITCTSLIVQLEQQLSDLCKAVVKELVSIVTSRVNQPDSHRLRSCACQCLIHLEDFEPGLLVNHCDDFCQLARQERTEVFQAYALLSAKVLSSTASVSGEKNIGLLQQGYQKTVQKQISYEPQDVRQMVAYLVENLPVYTRSGTFRIVESLSSLVKCMPEISPMIFKPPMLHQMSTMSCVIFHTVLYLQREFKGEILSQQEEVDLIQRLCNMTDHPSLNQLHRLLASQWAHMYQVDGKEKVVIHDSIKQKHRLIFYPSVFDPIDCQLRKLYMTAVCGETSHDIDGVETSILLGSLGCLHKLVWHTGSGLAARCLFKALYFIYTYHNNKSFSKDIQRFVRGLISEFAHFIPHSIDFADSINSLGIDRQVYVDTLSLLHQQVVMATEEQICSSFQFYLEIMKKAGAHKEIDPKPTLKFLTYLAENADIIEDSSWKLGHGILDICRNMIMCHGTHICFLELGDLLYYMMTCYNDTDVQDKARFYYALITGATDKKVQSVLKTSLSDVESMTEAITSLLPGTTNKVSLAKIIPLDAPVFYWQRISVDTATQKLKTKHAEDNRTDGIESPLLQYEEELKNLQVSLDLKGRLKLREDSKFSKVHAVSIHVEASQTFQPIPNRHIACLTDSGYQDVVLKVVPKLPLPLSLSCSVEFSSDSKQTYSTVIDPLYVEFSHLLMKLPWEPSDFKNIKFSTLWDWVLNRKIEDRVGVESVKLFSISVEKFKQVHDKHLSQFLFEEQKDLSEWCYTIFLPPCYHILLKCRSTASDSIVVSIATDLWTILSHIDTYLDDIIK
ncbi:AP-5 complex subunit beta-1-like isoform X1 [Mercenaria mercenaria]|uniref:AP-5 complex subunit beta-1-like isoform X1 n=1 Tax=Mercenaria mercenaria TaxID=6596 RepID=UPI00234F03CE|nr:AP-5 complex subunit beta-1-like isoform X1 [Mercenaria mercenaria]